MRNSIEEFWDYAAKDYRVNQWEKNSISKFDYALTKNVLLKYLKPNKNDYILEIGCGPGKWTKLLSERCKSIVAIDISKAMVNQAKRYCRNKNVSFINGDITKLNFDQKFDKILAVRSLEYIKDKNHLLNKIMHLLKHSGKIVIITKTKPCLWDMTKKVKNFWQNKISYSHLRKLCEKLDFINITIKPVIIRLPIFADGNREFPIIGKKYEKMFLKFFMQITKIAQKLNEKLLNLPVIISESYLLCAEKG